MSDHLSSSDQARSSESSTKELNAEHLARSATQHPLERALLWEPSHWNPNITQHTMPISTPSLERLLETDIREPLPSEITAPILSQSPFVPVLNGRDLGLVPGSAIAPGRFYRAGQLNASSAGWEEWLKANVGVIVDFRHSSERERAPEPSLGLNAIWHEPKDTHRPDLDIFTGDGSEGWKLMYLKYLVIYADTIRAVLQHVRDERGPILFHCSGE